MTCAECQERLAAFALGALEPGERAEVEAHLAEAHHEGCLEKLDDALRAVDALPAALPPLAPRREMWTRIAAQVAPRRRPWRAASGWLVAAALLVGLLLVRRDGRREIARHETMRLGYLEHQELEVKTAERDLRLCREELARSRDAVAVLGAPGARVVAFAAQGDDPARATAVLDVKAGKAIVIAHGAEPPAGHDYELWVIRGEAKKPAGLLRGKSVVFPVDPALLAGGVDALAVTLEKAGGVDVPAGPIVLVAALTP